MKCALAVMARTPELHATKTRLQSELGARGALRAHVRLVEDALMRLQGLSRPEALSGKEGPSGKEGLSSIEVSIWVTQVNAQTRAWADYGNWPLHTQPDGDLGQRMHGILSQLLKSGADRACVIGTDCPEIDARYIEAACAALERADLVIGPAEDGGYGLIGLKAPAPGLFTDIPWGSDQVLARTIKRAEEAALTYSVQPVIWDVDTPDDWRRYLQWSD